MDFYEDAVTLREKEGAVEEITSGDRTYQARGPSPLSTIKYMTTELKSAGLIEEVVKDGNSPIYAPVESTGGTLKDRPTGRPTSYTEDEGTISRQWLGRRG